MSFQNVYEMQVFVFNENHWDNHDSDTHTKESTLHAEWHLNGSP